MGDFTAIYDRYVGNIFNFIYYKTHHKETAEDLTSETFTKAFKNFGSFDENKGPVSAWLYRIARNTVIDFYRKKKITNINIEDIWDLAQEGADFARDFDSAESLKKVKEKLKDLKAEQREIVILHIWEEMSYGEIAEIMGKSENACKMAFLRAVKTLVASFELERIK